MAVSIQLCDDRLLLRKMGFTLRYVALRLGQMLQKNCPVHRANISQNRVAGRISAAGVWRLQSTTQQWTVTDHKVRMSAAWMRAANRSAADQKSGPSVGIAGAHVWGCRLVGDSASHKATRSS